MPWSSPTARTDLFHPETVRGSVGTLFKLPVADGHDGARRSRGLARSTSASSSRRPRRAEPCWEADLAGPVAVVVGNERYGVSRAWLDAADEAVSVPMPGPTDSLNVAVAAGVVLFEAARQRALIASIR